MAQRMEKEATEKSTLRSSKLTRDPDVGMLSSFEYPPLGGVYEHGAHFKLIP